MLETNSHDSVLLPFWGYCFKMLLLSGGPLLLGLIGGQKINVTFG